MTISLGNYEVEAEEGSPGRFIFHGKGLPRFTYSIPLESSYDAELILRLIQAAYLEGRRSKALEIRHALEIADTPWGVKIG